MKSFKEFLQEADSRTFYGRKDDLLKSHNGKLPDGHRAGYRPGRGWFASSVQDERASKQRREERKKPLTRDDFHSYAKRNLISKPREFADIADHREQHAISQKEQERSRRKQRFGIEYHVDHSQPLSQEQRKRQHKSRFYAVTPGHASQNLELKTKTHNIRKGDAPPKKGEHGSNFTRSGAIRHTANDTKEFIKNMDSTIGNVQGHPAKRMAKAYDRLTGLKSKK